MDRNSEAMTKIYLDGHLVAFVSKYRGSLRVTGAWREPTFLSSAPALQ